MTRPPRRPPADLVWLEPCANPFMTFPDLDAAIAAAHDAGARVVVDNTVLSPLLLRPLEHGADFVMHSASKILAGHHDALLGVVTCARTEDHERLAKLPRRHRDRRRPRPGVAAAARAQDARGPRGSASRRRRSSWRAGSRATRAVQTVRYPGLGDPVAARYVSAFGTLLSFDVADAEQALAVERGLRLIENATSLGGVASTLEARARYEGDRVPPGLLRLSAGLEDVEDLWADLAQALDALAPG